MVTGTQKTIDMRHIFTHNLGLQGLLWTVCVAISSFITRWFEIVKSMCDYLVSWHIYSRRGNVEMEYNAEEQWQKIIPLHLTAPVCWAKAVETKHGGWWPNPSHKNKAELRSKMHRRASRGRRIHVAQTTNQWKWVTTVIYRGTNFVEMCPASRIKNCQWDFEECDFSNKHTVHFNEAIEKECMFTWTIVHGQNDRKQQEWEENGGKLVFICAVLTQTARRYLFMWAWCRRAELISP